MGGASKPVALATAPSPPEERAASRRRGVGRVGRAQPAGGGGGSGGGEEGKGRGGAWERTVSGIQ